MFWIRSMAVAVFLCATSSAFAEGMIPFGGEYFNTPLASPVSADASFSAFGVVGATDFVSVKLPPEALSPMPLVMPRHSMASVPLLGTSSSNSWQDGHGAQSAETLLNDSSPMSWNLSTLKETVPSSFGMSREKSASVPRLVPDLASPIMQQDLMTPGWKVTR
jgi:hypothetical protein